MSHPNKKKPPRKKAAVPSDPSPATDLNGWLNNYIAANPGALANVPISTVDNSGSAGTTANSSDLTWMPCTPGRCKDDVKNARGDVLHPNGSVDFYDGTYLDKNGNYYKNGQKFDKDGNLIGCAKSPGSGDVTAANGDVTHTDGSTSWGDGSYTDACGNFTDTAGVMHDPEGNIILSKENQKLLKKFRNTCN